MCKSLSFQKRQVATVIILIINDDLKFTRSVIRASVVASKTVDGPIFISRILGGNLKVEKCCSAGARA